MAKSVAAAALPTIGASSSCASPISATSVRPPAWNTAAAVIRMAEFTSSASDSAAVLSMVAKRIASRFSATLVAVGARLHHGGMQIKIVRHHGRAEDADGDVELRLVRDDAGRGQVAREHLRPDRLRHARAARRSSRRPGRSGRRSAPPASAPREFWSQRISRASSAVSTTPSSSGMPNSNCSAMAVPISSARSVAQMAISASTHSATLTGRGKAVAAELRQVASGDDAEARAEGLQQHGHQRGEQRDGKQRVAEGRPAGERRRPVARVHVADRHQVAGPDEGEQPPQPAGGVRDGDAPVHLRQAHLGWRRRRRRVPGGSASRNARRNE